MTATKKIIFDEKDFLLKGKLDIIKLGMNESDLKKLLPKPEMYSDEKTFSIWSYNGLELHFEGKSKEERKLFLIFSDTFQKLKSSGILKYKRWIIPKTTFKKPAYISLPNVINILNKENVKTEVKYFEDIKASEILITESKVRLHFDITEEKDTTKYNENEIETMECFKLSAVSLINTPIIIKNEKVIYKT